MLTQANRDELSELISELIEGKISHARFDRLETLLRSDPNAVEYYVEYVTTHRLLASRALRGRAEFQQDRALADRLAATPGDSQDWPAAVLDEEPDYTPSAALEHLFEEAERTRRQRKRVRVYGWLRRNVTGDVPGGGVSQRRRAAAWGSIAALVALAASVAVWFTWPAPPPVPVATFVAGAGATFADRPPLHPQDALHTGPLSLTEGVAQIDFAGGARVVVQAPAEFELLTADRMALTRGRLVARVPAHAVGFVVRTPHADVVDLGTEFAASVDEQGRVEVHVFEGRVALRALDDSSAPNRDALVLNKGESRRLVQPLDADDRQAGATSMAEQVTLSEASFIRTMTEARRRAAPLAVAAKPVVIGDALIDRPMNDGAIGSVFVFAQAFESTGRVTAWAFFDNDNAGQQITPLLLKPAAGRWEVVGIGKARASDGSGAQHHPFEAVTGADRVEPGYVFGWKDGGAGTVNAGVIDYQEQTSAGAIWMGAGHTRVTVGDRYASVAMGTPLRGYSVQATVSGEEDKAIADDDGRATGDRRR